MMLLVTAALAVTPEAYPLRAELALPPAGVSRVRLPPDLVGTEPDDLGRTLRVNAADGTEVPFAVLLSTHNPEPTSVDLELWPTGFGTWRIDGAERPVDTIVFDLYGFPGQWGAWARITADGWEGRRIFLYEGDVDGTPFTIDSVPVGHRVGPFLVTLTGVGDWPVRLSDVEGRVYPPEFTEPVVEPVPAVEPVLVESGMARWTVRLPGARRIVGLRILADGTVFDRRVGVGVPGETVPESLPEVGTVRRLEVGEAHVDQDTVPLDLAGDTLLVDIETDRGVPLPVTGFEVISVGAELVVRDPGPAPQAVLAGTFDADTAHDLSYGAVELLRGDVVSAVAPVPVPNPGYVPLPTRDGVDGVGALVNPARFRFQRPIDGAAGWVRVPIDATVVAHARADLADLRVVDGEGRMVPYVLRALGGEVQGVVADVVREEVGGHSRLRIPVPTPDGPVASVVLRTSQARFARQVQVLRDRGRMTEPVRGVTWASEGVGSTLSIALNDHFGKAVLVDIDNGDNAPLPIDEVRLGSPTWELRARVPEGGARLLYGAPGEHRPTWDLALLEEEIWRMPLGSASLGPETATTGPELGAFEKLVVVGAVGLLAVGLLGMTVRALRTVAPPADPAEP